MTNNPELLASELVDKRLAEMAAAKKDSGAVPASTAPEETNQESKPVNTTENTRAHGHAEVQVAKILDKVRHPEITFTRFKGKKDTAGHQHVVTWPRLCETLREPNEYADIDSLPLLKFSVLPGNSRAAGARHDNMTAIVGDYDGGEVSFDEAVASISRAGIAAVVYTTRRHTPEAPRWRVVAQVASPIDSADYIEHVDALNGALGGVLATESWEASRCYFYGRVRGVEYLAQSVKGVPLDSMMYALSWDPISKPARVGKATVKGTQALPVVDGDLDRAITLARVNDDTVADLGSALEVFTVEDADDYNIWVNQMGHALKSLAQAGREAEALAMWHAFSSKSVRYDHDEAQNKWDGIEPDRITYASIFTLATARGWVNPRSAEALKANATAATRLDRTDAGNVALLASLVNGDLRYVPERRAWLGWDGQRWTPDPSGTAAQAAALQVAEHYHRKAAEIRKQASSGSLDAKERQRMEQAAESLEKWANQCRNKKALDNMLQLAQRDERFVLGVENLDRDPWLFGVDNGVVDLRTGELREASRDEYVTRRAPVAFNPSAKAPRWEQFIGEVTAKPGAAVDQHTLRPALASYLQRAVGYAMTGTTGEQKMFIAIGEGSNGKNVLLDMLQWIMGDYCQTVQAEALMATRHDADSERPSPTAATLAGARAAISSESKDGQRLDVALVKRHTGGGYMTARFLRENVFRFEISHELFLMTNHRPALDHMDDAMRGRLHLIPFDMRWNRPGHPARNPQLPDGDKDLPAKLRAEAEGVLAWLVAGAVAYHRDGLEPPAEVVRMTRDFFNDQDPLGRWLDTCTRCDAKSGMPGSELYKAFTEWQTEEGEEGGPTSQKGFSTELKRRGVGFARSGDANLYGLRS